MRLLLSLVLSIGILLSFSLGYAQPVEAMIRQQEEAPGQVLYQSRHSWRDETGSPWQIVLFKRVKNGEVKDINLRLVGFPEQSEFVHPQELKIVTAQGSVFQAPDMFAKKSPVPNVGQYDFQDILSELPDKQSIELTLPLTKMRSLSIPIPVLLEWREILTVEK